MAKTLNAKGAKSVALTLTDNMYAVTAGTDPQDDGFVTVQQVKDVISPSNVIVINPDKANISAYLGLTTAGVYDLPAAHYIIQGTVDFGTDRIECKTNTGFYVFRSSGFGTITYSGTSPFVQEASGVTGVIMDCKHFFVITPNATAFKLVDGNSFISNLVVYLLCDRSFDIDGYAFVTLNNNPQVACDKGALLNNIDTINGGVVQFNAGPDLGGVGFTLTGASSGRCSISQVESRPESTESMWDIQASYSGDVQMTGGIHTTGGGSFFKSGTRDQSDIDIGISSIKNVKPSTISGGLYIADGAEALTLLGAESLDTPLIVAGTWTEVSGITERVTIDSAGKVTYTGKEDARLNISVKMLVDPAGGSNRVYWAHIRKNGTTLDLLSRDTVTADSANPVKMVMFTKIDVVTGDYVEVVIQAVSAAINVTCSAQSFIIGMA